MKWINFTDFNREIDLFRFSRVFFVLAFFVWKNEKQFNQTFPKLFFLYRWFQDVPGLVPDLAQRVECLSVI